MSIAKTPIPPYFAVIFTSLRTATDEGYADMGKQMEEAALLQDGYLGIESARSEMGITVSYWASMEAIRAWKAETSHRLAQKYGREKWYSAYKVRVCKVERDYDFP
jgi:heme-degrading monooxygenase HmoA